MTPCLAFIQHSQVDVPGVLGDYACRSGFEVRTYRADDDRGELPDLADTAGVVVLGSIESVTNHHLAWIAAEREFVADAVRGEVPVLGVCFGGQLLAQVLGGQVHPARQPEVGWMEVSTDDPLAIPAGPWLLWHEDAFTLPPGATLLAHTSIAPQAFVKGIHTGLQFHPEVTARIVHRWIEKGSARGNLATDEREAVVDALDGHVQDSAANARLVFDGYLRRARLLPPE